MRYEIETGEFSAVEGGIIITNKITIRDFGLLTKQIWWINKAFRISWKIVLLEA